MKRTVQRVWLVLIGAMLLYGLVPCTGLANVCSQGTGVPPFLSTGAKPNLLMVLDNSGSMLDAAYTDSAEANPCFDDSYSSDGSYAGYFESEQWYEWKNGMYDPWQNGKEYNAEGARVYSHGIIWEVAEGGIGTSSGTSILDDEGVVWKHAFSIDTWNAETAYSVEDFVWSGPQLYRALTSSTGVNPDDDDGSNWKAVDSTWVDGKTYNAGNIVTYKGILYETSEGGTSSGTGVYDDSVSWQRLDEGFFKTSDDTLCTSATYKRTDTSSAGGYDLCMKLDTTVTPNQVTGFVAKGKLLNWAMSSKFDVEKKILTGGKYNDHDDFLVTEHRGCSGARAIKQVQFDGTGSAAGYYLSMGVRGPKFQQIVSPSEEDIESDRIDTTDYTGRLEIFGVTETGYATKCEDLYKAISAGGNLNSLSNDLDTCLGQFNEVQGDFGKVTRSKLINETLQFCRKYDEFGGQNDRNPTNLVNACREYYTNKKKNGTTSAGYSKTYLPDEFKPTSGAYFCYGIFDASIEDHKDRGGYIGRCWDTSGANSDGPATCDAKDAVPLAAGGCDGDPCEYGEEPLLYKNEGGYNYKCDPDKFDKNGNCKNNGWSLRYEASDGSGPCDPAIFSSDGTNDFDWEDPAWDDDLPTDDPDNCLMQAAYDYCDDLTVPEVIDPSGQAGETGDLMNLPAVILDGELVDQMGGGGPIAVMKGYVQETERPQGIIHSVAQDLRLGLMSFNYVGAATECEPENLTDGIKRYCPQENKDGAELLAELKDGDLVNGTTGQKHVDDVAEAINSIRATSWTPLAEALYAALGYYTQNDIFCLNREETCVTACQSKPDAAAVQACIANCACEDDFLGVDDPVNYWCQDNHILLITEGESTADINEAVTTFSPDGTEGYVSDRPDTCKCSPDNKDLNGACNDDAWGGDADADTFDPSDASDTPLGQCSEGVFASTYLDDMTWWGQHIYPLYKERCVTDADKRQTEKKPILTHLVTTGALTDDNTDEECNPATLMTNAAKHGGTTDYYAGESPEALEDNLVAILDDILSRSSAGSAASVISSSRSGAGAVYQAIFWPEYKYEVPKQTCVDNCNTTFSDTDAAATCIAGCETKTQQIDWVGDVHALFMSAEGLMYEDTNHDGKLDPSADLTNSNPDGNDKRVIFYFSTNVNKTRGCYDIVGFRKGPDGTEGTADDYQCPGDTDQDKGTHENDWVDGCTADAPCVEIKDINYLWAANEQLEVMDVLKDRKLYTWNDANNNGKVDAAEWFRLDRNTDWQALNDLVPDSCPDCTDPDSDPDSDPDCDPDCLPRGPVTRDFLTEGDWDDFAIDANTDTDGSTTSTTGATGITDYENDALDAFADWMLGRDQSYTEQVDDEASNSYTGGSVDKELRSRTYLRDGINRVWRLGDVIHSTPIVVSRPAEAYQYIYRDSTYKKFADRWKNRRSVIYFGSNDGMLHAVNGGFYIQNTNQFCCVAPDSEGK
ncbi:hypothetical protein GKODMF_05700 [Candidatus Electrothrix gigas]